MSESRFDAFWERLGRSGRFRAELLVLIALIFTLGHTAEFLNAAEVDIGKSAERLLSIGILVVAIAIRISLFKRISPGNIFTFQYHGWYRVGKLLERSDDVSVVRIFDEQFTERPRKVNKNTLSNEEAGGTNKIVAMSAKEFDACEPKVIAYGEVSNHDKRLIENPPQGAWQATVHH